MIIVHDKHGIHKICNSEVQKRSSDIDIVIVDSNKKGQPGACSSRLRKVRGRARPLWVLCTQSFPAFLQEVV
jgi:hypothetical protein